MHLACQSETCMPGSNQYLRAQGTLDCSVCVYIHKYVYIYIFHTWQLQVSLTRAGLSARAIRKARAFPSGEGVHSVDSVSSQETPKMVENTSVGSSLLRQVD